MKFSMVTKAVLMTSLMFGSAVTAKEFKVLPILDNNFCPNIQVGLSTGYMNLKNVNAEGATVGIEISLDCPVFTLPWDNLRQQIMLNHFNSDGLEMTNLEFNPYYLISLGNNVEWGFGPGFGVIFSKAQKSDTVFTLQAGSGLKYNISKELYTGADIRYQWTQKADLSDGYKEDLDNYRAQVKIGYRF
ncbi:outer membrane beta-barrel protein [Sulfuricurvum sp.]|uniref:outer membrane protein n=1 Tax=Sulfuricurvum sp. TaxID=2025608 RepID=UPI002D51532E|nr:outer membrane beta-barrel protein [Sulfuricurvum sp.]HZF70263.1 outer membrane beta-barrel protein [Sulfuricurvum sp.]